jgi:spore maturation protein CgeB
MRFVIFCHSLLSDWNHGNAHFLRGVVTDLVLRGHEVQVFEPRDAWSVQNLVAEHGEAALWRVHTTYPNLQPQRYDPATLQLEHALEDADVVIVHEWNEPDLVARVGRLRAAGGAFTLVFHDTHHRAITAPEQMQQYDLQHYDGVLAFGSVIRDIYLQRGWAHRAWTWHEAADTRVFHPMPQPSEAHRGDVVWIGNWGDGERTHELQEFLIDPIATLKLRARVYGVRYPADAMTLLQHAGIDYRGWLPNYEVPSVFAGFRVTVHVPRGPYTRALPGIPTIRPFEAMACGIPLISAPWEDSEQLFTAGTDYLVATSGKAMQLLLRKLLNEPDFAASIAASALGTIRARHTCVHRVSELLQILSGLRPELHRHAVTAS